MCRNLTHTRRLFHAFMVWLQELYRRIAGTASLQDAKKLHVLRLLRPTKETVSRPCSSTIKLRKQLIGARRKRAGRGEDAAGSNVRHVSCCQHSCVMPLARPKAERDSQRLESTACEASKFPKLICNSAEIHHKYCGPLPRGLFGFALGLGRVSSRMRMPSKNYAEWTCII